MILMNYQVCIRNLMVLSYLLTINSLVIGQDYQISYLSVENGLSHNEVTSIIQDNYGYMWFGTQGGLNKYDGYQFKHYKPNRKQSTSIQDASVESLFRDSNGRIWIGTQSGGFSFYDSVNDQFEVPSMVGNFNKFPIISFDEDSKGNILISSWGNGLIKVRPDSSKREVLVSQSISRSVKCINDTLIYWGDQTGLRYMGQDKVAKRIRFREGYHDPTEIVVDRANPYIWIVGWKLNLICYDYSNGTIRTFKLPWSQSEEKPAFSIMQDKDGDLWIGTLGNGLYKFSVEDQVFKRIKIKPQSNSRGNRDYDIILDIFQDIAGNIWIGTGGGGIVKLSKKSNFYAFGNNSKSAIGGQHITAVLEDRNGVLWVGTKGRGLFTRNGNGRFKKVSIFKHPVESEFEYEDVRNIYQSDDGLIWVSFNSTLFVVRNASNGTKELVSAAAYFNSPALNIRKPIDMAVIDNQLWVATEQLGLFCFEKVGDKYVLKKNVDKNEDEQLASIWGLVLDYDHQKRLWVGTKSGLYLYQPESNTYVGVNTLISNDITPVDQSVLCIYTDKSENVWFGTPSSLNQLIEEPDGSFKLIEYTKKDGLPDDYINAILSDEEGDIWISTNNGISRYDKQNKGFRNYNISDGIAGLNFSESSACVGKGGRLYFGGYNGLTYFNASDITDNNYMPPIVITEFKILNKSIPVDGKVLNESINEQQRIVFNHQQNEFSFEFAALDYKASHLNHYAYWLEGGDSERILLGDRRHVSFSNLKPGEYILHLYGTNSNGIWSEVDRRISLSVLPAPWKTWYANAIYVIIILLVVFIIMKVVRKQEQLNRNVEMEKLLREKQKQLNEDKLRFFTNISHEIRTPLTLIMAPVNELLRKDFTKLRHDFIRNKIEIVYNNTSKLLQLVNQLLEFRKIEADKIRLQASENNLIDFVKQICKPFEEYAVSQNINFKLHLKFKWISLYFDAEKLGIVLNNLFFNALKYAGQPGRVDVDIEDNNDSILIRITNNGKGISSANIPFLFDRFYQGYGQSFSSSSGIGLSLVKSYVELHKGVIEVDSIPGELTTFTIKLMKGNGHLLANEIVQEPTIVKSFQVYLDNETKAELSKPKRAIKGSTILVVEDNNEVRNYLKSLLEDDFDVIEAKDGFEAFDNVVEYKPELVISDVMMPRMDGFELCQKIKANPLISQIPVILLTAKGEKGDEVRGTRMGADAYLTKPFDTVLLFEKINMLIESRRTLFNKYSDKVVLEPKDEEIEAEDAKFLKTAMSIIEVNIGNIDFTPEYLADKMAMSYTTLYRKCKKIVDLTPSAFIRSIRLKRAAQLLRDSDLTVMEIMDSVAYLDIKNFRRNFMKEFEKSPSEYRKQYKV